MGTWSGGVGRALRVALLGFVLCSCSVLPNPERFGIRPDVPLALTSEDRDPCAVYDEYLLYVRELQEAYHARASQNRGWIYVAAILGLSVAAAAGGLGIAAAAAGTIALLTVAGGAGTGFFAIIDNPTLADIYTISANDLERAINDPTQGSSRAFAKGPAGCAEALEKLRDRVSVVRADLESARTDSAKAAVMRAAAQQELIKRQAAALGLATFELIPSRTELARGGPPAIVVINGGQRPYRVTADETALAVTQPTSENPNQAIIAAKKGAILDKYNVVFQDGAARVRTLPFQVTDTAPPAAAASHPLTVKALTGEAVALGGLRTVFFGVSGGKPPYTAARAKDAAQKAIGIKPSPDLPSDQPMVIAITVLDGADPGPYKVEVVDSAKESKEFTVTAASGLEILPKTALSVKPGQTVQLSVAGGLPPYEVRTSAPKGTLTAAISQNRHFIDIAAAKDAKPSPDPYKITVRDALGQEISTTIAVVP